MGLLDDAIREHLELKRLRGADPGLVSREESQVFGPIKDVEPGGDDSEIGASESSDHQEASSAGEDPAQSAGFSHVGQETAELDMRSVLESESSGGVAPVAPATAGPVAARPQSGAPSDESSAVRDSPEWEMPGDGRSGASEEDVEDDPTGDMSGDEPVEDVLEATPDFLRDTPEQERLWFEQRPPRDFDFDK